MGSLTKVNQWICDHKILSGIAGVVIMGIVTFALAKNSGADEYGNINFED